MASLLEQLHMWGRFGACIVAGAPSTTLIPLPLTIALTSRFRREERLKRLHFMVPWARFCRDRILDIRLDVVGKEHVPASTRGFMYVSNHQSYVDILVLMEVLDTVAFLAKGLIKWIPVIGICAYAGGTIFFDRGASGSRTRALQDTLRMCRESTAVVVFPEGTRSGDGGLRPKIHPGAIKGAFGQGLKVIPVGIDGTYRVLPKTMDRFAAGQRVAVTIGEPIDPAGYTDEEAWVKAVWGRVSELFQQSHSRAG